MCIFWRRAAPQTLSGGLRQRLVLAAVAAMRPQVLVCDEPLSQLDVEAARALLVELRRLRDQGVAVVLAEHRLDDVLPHADRLLVLDAGRLVADVDGNDAAQVAAALKTVKFAAVGARNLFDNGTGDEEAPELADLAAPGFDRQVISKFAALGQRCLDL